MMHRRACSLGIERAFPILFWAALATAPAAAQGLTGLSISAGIDYTTGDYGSAADTEIVSFPVTGKLELGPWAVALTIPYIRIDGPGDVVGGGVVTKKGKERGTTTSTETSGLGDIVGAVTFTLPTPPATPTIDLTGKIKIPTASESKNLGTGEFDYTAQVDVLQRIGPVTPYGTLGYRILGEPDGVDLNNQVLIGVGASVDLSRSFTAGLSLDYRTSSTDQADDPAEATPYVTWSLAPAFKLNVYGLVGLSDGSPDYGGGLKLILAP
jgi:hypothetical protein